VGHEPEDMENILAPRGSREVDSATNVVMIDPLPRDRLAPKGAVLGRCQVERRRAPKGAVLGHPASGRDLERGAPLPVDVAR
jgi:hypothetical protein